MMSILVVQNGASEAAVLKTLEAARSTGAGNVTVIASQSILADLDDVTGIDAAQSLRHSLAAAFDETAGSHLMVLDARLAPERHEVQALLGAMARERGADYICASLQRGTQTITLHDFGVDNLVNLLSSNAEWPLLCVGVKIESARQIAPFEGEGLSEILAHLLIKGLSRGQTIAHTSYTIKAPPQTENSLRFSGEPLARLLKSSTSLYNIEDLFPAHPWTSHDEESAAAAYHSLAALFVRFGDLESAGECLRISDQFEDSPRSLALKGIISQRRGEMLGAVANLVASLQQYEMRKHDNHKHYVHFSPGNVEKISDNLQAGLIALNRSDNDAALACFAQAVFNFDPFFKESGLEFKDR